MKIHKKKPKSNITSSKQNSAKKNAITVEEFSAKFNLNLALEISCPVEELPLPVEDGSNLVEDESSKNEDESSRKEESRQRGRGA